MQLHASAKLIYEEALHRGYEVETFKDHHLLRISRGDKWYYTRGSRSSKLSSVGTTIADNKWLTRQILTKQGLPMARGGFAKTYPKLDAILKRIHFPIVIKPVSGAHGIGVIVGIKTQEKLKRYVARRLAGGLIVEECLQGNDYRVLVVNHKVVAVAHRLPAFVEGDGLSTINQLLKKENKRPERGRGHTKPLTRIKVDESVLSYLKEQGKDLTSVLQKGETVFLRKTAGLSTGGVGIDKTAEVCRENIKLFEKLSRVCDLLTVGIDVMAKNLSTPLVRQKRAGILEINASPGLRMHHYPYQGKARDAAGAILDMLFGKGKK